MKPSLVVLAAGMGSRYGGVKQMDGFGPNNQWLLEYSVYDAINAGFGQIVFILRASILDDFKAYFEQRLPDHIERAYVLQELDKLPNGIACPKNRVKPWGTGHAVLVTKDVVDRPFAVINADDFYGAEAYQQMATFLNTVESDSYHLGMVGYLLKNTLSDNGSVSRGVCSVDKNNQLIKVEEHTKIERQATGEITNTGEGSHKTLDENTIVSMNCWAFTPAIFGELERQFSAFLEKRGQEEKSEFYIPFAVQEMKEDGLATVEVMTSTDNWFGVTYAADQEVVRKELAQLHAEGKYPKELWNS